MSFKIVDTYSTGDYSETNVWECTTCGFTASISSDGDCPCECPKCLANEYEDDDERRCNICNKIMSEGYCISGGEEYYCSDDCLHEKYTEAQWSELYDEGNSDSYWTTWEDE